MKVAVLLNRKQGGFYFASLGFVFLTFREMRLEQNAYGKFSYARKVCFRRAHGLSAVHFEMDDNRRGAVAGNRQKRHSAFCLKSFCSKVSNT